MARSALILGAAGAVGWGLVLALGPPSPDRIYHQDEVRRFAPSAGHGLGQLAGEAFLLLLVAVLARRYLRVRL